MKSLSVRRRIVFALGVTCAIGATATPGRAQSGAPSESAVKAAFVYRFGTFVEWPPGTFVAPASPVVIGVYGDDQVAGELEQITQGRDIAGHPVAVRRIREPGDLPDLHILFVGGPRESRAAEVLAAARGPVLTVANGPLGGQAVLHFSLDQGRVRFSASLPAAAARNLRLSARLLAVAQQVEPLR